MKLEHVAALLAAVLPGACDRREQPPPRATSSAGAPASAVVAPPSSSAPVTDHAPTSSPTCRAIGVKGDVTFRRGGAIHDGTPVLGDDWVTLARGASATFKHSSSGRELTLSGPALAFPCRGGDELVLLASGKLSAAPGMGARPGAEVLVATEHGAVRWGEGQLELNVTARTTEVVLFAGEAWLDPARGAKLKGPGDLRGSRAKAQLSGGDPASALVEECERLASEAETAARRVIAPDPAEAQKPLGERGARHIEARRAARSACAVAAAALGDVPPAGEQAARRIEAAERRWRQLPAAAGGGPAPAQSAPQAAGSAPP